MDVGSGPGAMVALLCGRGLRAVGLDYGMALATESATVASSVSADAERSPFRSGSMDAAFMECVFSAVPDKRAAIDEVARPLRPGSSIVISDVVVEGPLPPPLDSLAGWIACAAGALPSAGMSASWNRPVSACGSRRTTAATSTRWWLRSAAGWPCSGAPIRAGLVDGRSAGLEESLVDLG